jgi:O-antigen/teichoic acid export membrane protein
VGLSSFWVRDVGQSNRLAIIASCLSLPIGALVHYSVEVLTAAGREVRATIIFRIGVPALTLVLTGILSILPFEITGAMAVSCWGVAWALALVLFVIEIRLAIAPEVWRAKSTEDSVRWNAESRPFWLYRVSLGLMGQAGVIALELLQPSGTAVGAYAAAMGTASLASVLVTATNRAYARELSILLDRQDLVSLSDARRARLHWLVPAVTILVLLAFTFTHELLAFFRPEFVDEGLLPLRLLAIATAFTMLFALAPTYLKFKRRNRATFITVACAAAAQILLLLLLVPEFGATGAATAYAVSIIGAYGTFALIARLELTRLGANIERF